MPRILALETSELTGSAAAAIDDNILAEINLPPHERSAQWLASAMESLLAQVGWRPRDVQLIAVTTGPGSFTGLRVGVVTAKVFAYATGAEILGVSTLAAIAAAAPPDVQRISAAVDAQRGDVVAQDFEHEPAGRLLTNLGTSRLLPLADWLAGLPQGFAVAGPILKKWTDPFPTGIQVLPAEFWRPAARCIARLAYRDYLAGRRDDPFQLVPVYSRPSAAEEKWAKRQK